MQVLTLIVNTRTSAGWMREARWLSEGEWPIFGGSWRDSSKGQSPFHAYGGVIPSTHSSGERSFDGKLIKEGNRWLRWAAVEAVWPALQADFELSCFYDRLKKRKGANVAKGATARRLLTILYRILKEKRAFIPYKRENNRLPSATS